MKNDILNRKDIFKLVTLFYDKVKTDSELDSFFTTVIHNWDEHIEHLTNFWESQLFVKNVFSGNPLKKHIEVDVKNQHATTSEHFGIWLNYWIASLDELYGGERAQLAKNRARNMGTYMFLEIFKART